MNMQRFTEGLTVTELKRLLTSWPERNEDDEPTEVWLSDGNGISNQAREVWPLRLCTASDGSERADLMLQHDASFVHLNFEDWLEGERAAGRVPFGTAFEHFARTAWVAARRTQ